MSNNNDTSFSNDVDTHTYLRSHDNEYAMQDLPAIIVLAILMLVGFVGNSLVCYLYLFKFKRSTNRYFIVALAVFDLISCTISVPIEISVMRFHYTFGAYTLCKFARVVVAFASMASGTMLITVAVDRYKKICRPFQSQITPFMAKVAILLCSIIAFAGAFPAVFIYGSKTVTTDNISLNGSTCSTADEYIDTPYPLIYNSVQFLCFISTAISLTVLYSLIWQQICRQQAFRESAFASKRNDRPETPKGQYSDSLNTSEDLLSTSSDALQQDKKTSFSPSISATTRIGRLETTDDAKPGDSFTDFHNNKTNLNRFSILKQSDQFRRNEENKISTIPSSKQFRIKSRRADRGVRRTTFMLFLVTVVFALSYFPHLGLMAARAVNKDVFKNLQGAELAAYNLFLRFYFINSASNPIIYSLYNAHFRRELKLLCSKFTCRS